MRSRVQSPLRLFLSLHGNTMCLRKSSGSDVKAVICTRCSCFPAAAPHFCRRLQPTVRSANLSTYILLWLESNCGGGSEQVADCQTDEGDRLHGDEVGRRASGANN